MFCSILHLSLTRNCFAWLACRQQLTGFNLSFLFHALFEIVSRSRNAGAIVSSAAMNSESNVVCGSMICSKSVTDDSGSMQCYECNIWYHDTSTCLSSDDYAIPSNSSNLLFGCDGFDDVTDEASRNVGLNNHQMWSCLTSLDRKVKLLIQKVGVYRCLYIGRSHSDNLSCYQLNSARGDGYRTQCSSYPIRPWRNLWGRTEHRPRGVRTCSVRRGTS